MANINEKLIAKNGLKKSISISTGSLAPADNTSLAIDDVVTLFTLPSNSVVTDVLIVVGAAPTDGTQELSVEVGGVEALAAVALGTVDGTVVGGSTTRLGTGTGADVTATLTVADLADGEIEVIVEYVEYTKTTGELTN